MFIKAITTPVEVAPAVTFLAYSARLPGWLDLVLPVFAKRVTVQHVFHVVRKLVNMPDVFRGGKIILRLYSVGKKPLEGLTFHELIHFINLQGVSL